MARERPGGTRVPAGRLEAHQPIPSTDTHTFTLTAGGTSASVTLSPASDAPSGPVEAVLSKRRIDTQFKFEVAFGDAPVAAEAFTKKPWTDTNSKFERRTTLPDLGSESGAGSGLTTTETQERVVSSDLADEATDAAFEAPQPEHLGYMPPHGAAGWGAALS